MNAWGLQTGGGLISEGYVNILTSDWLTLFTWAMIDVTMPPSISIIATNESIMLQLSPWYIHQNLSQSQIKDNDETTKQSRCTRNSYRTYFSFDCHGRSVTEIWGRDEMKNADLLGGRNKEFGPFGGRHFKYGHVYTKSLKNRHIMAKR